MTRIKPCPFCGGKAEMFAGTVECEDCGARISANGITEKAKRETLAAWNHRDRQTCHWEPAKVGYPDDDGWEECSECGEVYAVEAGTECFNYCPNCGAKVTEREKITSDADEPEEVPYLAIDPGKEEETTLNTECLDCGEEVEFSFAEMMRCAYDRDRERPACPKCGRRLEIGMVRTYDWDTGEWKEVDQ